MSDLKKLRHNMASFIREEMLDGHAHLVVPTVLICEGVHNNLYYPPDELATFTDAWNGRPVVIFHPEDAQGNPTTANSPDLFEKQTVGTLFKANWDPDQRKLKAEAWLRKDKLSKISPECMAMLIQDEPIEVSTGLFTENEAVEDGAQWNGEEYVAIARNYRPDHLALLPGSVGACSWDDGAGMPRLNRDKSGDKSIPSVNFLQRLTHKIARKCGLTIHELSHWDIQDSIYAILSQNYPDDVYTFIKEIYDKYFIYSVENNDGVTMYKQAYSVGADDKVEFSGDPVEVVEKKEFVPVMNSDSPKEGDDDVGQEEKDTVENQAKGEHTVNKTELIQALIENGQWTDEDKGFLEGLEEEQLQKMHAPIKALAEKETEEPDPEKETEEPEPTPNEEEKPQSAEEFIANAPEEIREVLEEGQRSLQARKDAIVDVLTKNEACRFSKQQLQAKKLGELENLLALSGETVDHTAQAPAEPETNEEDEDVPDMPEVNYDRQDG
jgi:hypothetical protein